MLDNITKFLHFLSFLCVFSGDVDAIAVVDVDLCGFGHFFKIVEVVFGACAFNGLGFDVFGEALVIEHLDQNILIKPGVLSFQ